MGLYATITGAMGVVGAVMTMMLTLHEPLVFMGLIWLLAVLLAVVGFYSSWAMLGGKM
jgi:hypothetical protein